MDAVEAAQSGHPGTPMALAPLAWVLWSRHLRYDPTAPAWPDRDRFVLSAGHASMLLYALLYLTGYGLTLDDLRAFRQWGSRTPGHPEHGHTPGVETTTGPLGQGFGNAVGIAWAEAHLAARFNREVAVVDHRTYVIASDGDLMEGVSHEAAALAGRWRLGKLIVFWDNNGISIDGSTALTFGEDVRARFAAYGWHTDLVADGEDLTAIDHAIRRAQADPRPSLVEVRTVIGWPSPKAGNEAAHGAPLGSDAVRRAKEALGWPVEPPFFVPEDVLGYAREVGRRGEAVRKAWEERVALWRRQHPALAEEWERSLRLEPWPLPNSALPTWDANDKPVATRAASGETLRIVGRAAPWLVGGSADLLESTRTQLPDTVPFTPITPAGRQIYFGVREHGMGAILNGIALHGGLRPFGSTFLVFSDYMRPAIRLAALMRLPVVYVFTHDSIGLGEDGPTHQPVEHLPALRAIPGLVDLRPADAAETVAAWRFLLTYRDGPAFLALTRQAVPHLDRQRGQPADFLRYGAYVVADPEEGEPHLLLLASGSEVALAVQAQRELAAEGIRARVVSMPSWALFEQQPATYRASVLPPSVPVRLAIEAARPLGWERWLGPHGRVIGLDRFGASAPGAEVFRHLGFTVERIVAEARDLLARWTETAEPEPTRP